ncbi:MAG: DUF3363 domain-containing protein [Myxococcales bacterium]|nr:DUF3363 domain-containing protein [Myxococcales bacterium]
MAHPHDDLPRRPSPAAAGSDDDRTRLRPKMGRRTREARLATATPGIARVVLRGHGKARRAAGKVGPLPDGVGPGRHARRVVIQTHIHRIRDRASVRAAADYLGYMEKEGAALDGSPAELYGANGPVDRARFAEERPGEEHQFRFIVSPEEGSELDLHVYVRSLMRRVQRDVGRSLEWVASNHHDSDHVHAHVVVRGVDLHGRRVLLSRQYISHGMRWTAQELATEHLGPRLERDIRLQREREVTQERFTSLDRELERCATGDHQVDLGAVRRRSRDDREAQDLVHRLEHLGRMGVARSIAPGSWQLAQGWEKNLRDLGERGDIIKRIHRAMRGVELSEFHPVRPGQGLPDGRGGIEERELVGHVVEKGFRDELRAADPYAILETAQGAAYHVRLGAEQARDLRQGDLVAFQTWREKAVRPADRHIAEVAQKRGGVYELAAGDEEGGRKKEAAERAAPARLRELAAQGLVTERAPGQWVVPANFLAELEARAPKTPRYRLSVKPVALSLDAQVRHPGPTWLDTLDLRELSRVGFGAEVRPLLEQRRDFVRGELGIDPDDSGKVAQLGELPRRALGRRLEEKVGEKFLEKLPADFRGTLLGFTGEPKVGVVSNGKEFGFVPAGHQERALVGQPVIVGRGAQGQVRVTLDRERAEDLERCAAGDEIANQNRMRTFLPTIPRHFRGWIKDAPEGARFLEVSEGLRFVLIPATPEARALIGKTVELSGDERGRLVGLKRADRDRGLER